MHTHYQMLKEKIFQGNNQACYIEREKILNKLDTAVLDVSVEFRYGYIFKNLLQEVSTPVDEHDIIVGRVVEAVWESNLNKENIHQCFKANGHLTLNWETLLKKGLSGVAQEAIKNAARMGTKEADDFAENAQTCVQAVKEFCHRYAETALNKSTKLTDSHKHNLEKAANALKVVPLAPAENFFEALQSMWMIHLITSCYIGARDFAFGRMDQFLLPFYNKSIENRELTRDDARSLLSHFMLKCNEITGTGTWNYKRKPIPCCASKQYVILGGKNPNGTDTFNDLSKLFLEAAEAIKMPQPVLTARLNNNTSMVSFANITKSINVLNSQIHFYNDELIIPQLIKAGVQKEDAYNYSAVGCCRIDIPGKMDDSYMKSYVYHNMTAWLMETLKHAENYNIFEELLNAFKQIVRGVVKKSVEQASADINRGGDVQFHFESLLLDNCVQNCSDFNQNGPKYRVNGHFFGGIATIADSFYTIKRLIFEEKRFTLKQFMRIVNSNFQNNLNLRMEIVNSFPKFGNNISDVDNLASITAKIVVDAFEETELPKNHIKICGLYSLDNHHQYGKEMSATPDGRLAGEPVSENQSPVYGADKNGITATLNSISKLPLDKTVMGGLNLQFSGKIPPEKIQSILQTYFASGGLHIGFTFVNKTDLRNAQDSPERYRSLCVRMYGFSEYFIALSLEEQIELINRTEY